MKPLITELSQLQEVAKLANQVDVIAVDTEFLREKTYRAKLCLVQLGIADHQYCIDVLAIDDLSPITEIMQNPGVLKIFHAARQDYEVLLETLGVLPKPLFDTQLAAAFCGSDMQVGHSALVEDRLAVVLPKSQARTDWSRRPLSAEQLAYAADDVTYLQTLYEMLYKDLEQQGKLDWYLAEIKNYYHPDQYVVKPENAYKRLYGGRLDLNQQAVLRELAAWREQMAQKRNLPRTWILKDDKLFDLVHKMPNSQEQLEQFNLLSDKQTASYGSMIAKIVRNTEPLEKPLWRRLDALTKEDKCHVKVLMGLVTKASHEHQLAKALLATRKDVESIYRYRQSDKLLSGWRQAVIGEIMQSHLNDIGYE